jgi:hypothetical protein
MTCFSRSPRIPKAGLVLLDPVLFTEPRHRTQPWRRPSSMTYSVRRERRSGGFTLAHTFTGDRGKTSKRDHSFVTNFELKTTNKELISIASDGQRPFLINPGRSATYRIFADSGWRMRLINNGSRREMKHRREPPVGAPAMVYATRHALGGDGRRR